MRNEDFTTLARLHAESAAKLDWNLVFMLPTWLEVWWRSFGSSKKLWLKSVYSNDDLIGIAPLYNDGGAAAFIGDKDVCDYQDFVIAPGKEKEFFTLLFRQLKADGIESLHLETIRPDSKVITHLLPFLKEEGAEIKLEKSDVSSEITLPSSWEDYLQSLDGKQRHEIKRKIKKLDAMAETEYRCIEEPAELGPAAELFLKLFPESRGDKARFLTDQMRVFFKDLASGLPGIAKFGLLESAGRPLAMVMYFDYNNSIYLYNSAYDPDYKSLSVGIISKARCIQYSISKGKTIFDFLKGDEIYKSYMGGKEITLYACHVKFNQEGR